MLWPAVKLKLVFYIAASDCVIKYNHIENAVTGILIATAKTQTGQVNLIHPLSFKGNAGCGSF